MVSVHPQRRPLPARVRRFLLSWRGGLAAVLVVAVVGVSFGAYAFFTGGPHPDKVMDLIGGPPGLTNEGDAAGSGVYREWSRAYAGTEPLPIVEQWALARLRALGVQDVTGDVSTYSTVVTGYCGDWSLTIQGDDSGVLITVQYQATNQKPAPACPSNFG